MGLPFDRLWAGERFDLPRDGPVNDIADDSDDNEEQFLAIADAARVKYDAAYEELEGAGSVFPLMHRYMSTVLPAAHFFKIDALAEWERPSDKVDNLRAYYDRFMDDVDYCVSELKLRKASRIKRNTVALSAAAKKQIGIWLQDGRELIEREDLDSEKKDRLLHLINKLQSEIDRERTPVHAAGQLLNTIFSYARQNYFTSVEPILRSIGLVSGEIGAADEAQHGYKPLPEYPKPKSIQPPRAKLNRQASGFDKALDDEIPF
jgi:hypothetical protein